MLRPTEDDRLVMQQLHYNDEIRDAKEVPVADADVKEAELKLARQLIDQIARETFNPGAYEDDVRTRIQEQIDRKVAGQEIAISPVEAPKAQIIDLMEALKQSLAKRTPPPEAAPKKTVKAEKSEKSSKKKA
jgi:DNA end-binding protein Ku